MPIAQPLRTGDPQRLGDYDLSGRLGEGGQGVVYLGALDGETYAVKLLHGPVGEERAAFLREVELAKHVARFCTAQVIDAGFADGRPYVVNEYVDGPSLHREVMLAGARGGASLERLAVGCATALAAIHRAGIVHRDFKPQNVLLGPDGPRVIDFGLARALDAAATQSGRGVGTPAYMAPEQITASAVSGQADVFAWGATMCFAANATAPFGQDSVAPVLHRILTAPPELGRLEGRLRELVAGCLEKDPRNRPASRDLLLELLSGVEGTAPRALAPDWTPVIPRPTPPGDDLPAGLAPPGGPEPPVPTADRDPEDLGQRRAEPEATGAYRLPPAGRTLSPPPPRRDRAERLRRVGMAVGAALLVSGAVVAGVMIPVLGRAAPQISAGPVAASTPASAAPTGDLPARRDSGSVPARSGPAVAARPPAPSGVTVPRLVGLDRVAAASALRAAGLRVGRIAETDSPREIGEVLGSVPAAGSEAPRGGRVRLTVSAGIAVPSLIGLARGEAETALLRAGLAVGEVTTGCVPEADGVISARPAAGTRVAGGTAVSFAVGRRGVTVPGVVGGFREEARGEMVAAGFAVQVRGRLVSDPASADLVLAQSLTPGSCARAGQRVVLTVGMPGQTGPSQSPSATGGSPPSPSSSSLSSSTTTGVRVSASG